MSHLTCPKCGEPLTVAGKSYVCPSHHTYDTAKSGYVNLNLTQHGGIHGDDRKMISARRDFLEHGYYLPLRDTICTEISKFEMGNTPVLCDAGCGEGWYTYAAAEKINAYACGFDLSSDALAYAAKRFRTADYKHGYEFAAASVYHLPLQNESCDILLNIFAPFSAAEYSRILRSGGYMIRVIPLERHLWGLKSVLYEKPYENEVQPYDEDKFVFLGAHEVKINLTIGNSADIEALFAMTPYYYKTSPADKQKLYELQQLETPAQFAVLIYQKSDTVTF